MKKCLIYFAVFLGTALMLCVASSAILVEQDTEPEYELNLLSIAKQASSRYINNTCKTETDIEKLNNTIILVEQADVYYSYTYRNGQIFAGEVYASIPQSINGFSLEKDFSKLKNIPNNIYIYAPQS